uniref:Uncharacterized protein n=1 Tax=Cannabis sativa TaxID=3483 RepID=A0A803QZU3_CANSA
MNFDEAVDKVLLSIPTREVVDPPPSLKHTEECALDEVENLQYYFSVYLSLLYDFYLYKVITNLSHYMCHE